MLEQILDYIHNYFEYRKVKGVFSIIGGFIDGCDTFLQDGQYFRVIGSVFNDGVWQYPTSELMDESFEGEVWALAIPPRLSHLADDIDAWMAKNKDIVESPYQSESFGGYSYTKASGNMSGNGGNTTASWQEVFGAQLNQWRKLA